MISIHASLSTLDTHLRPYRGHGVRYSRPPCCLLFHPSKGFIAVALA